MWGISLGKTMNEEEFKEFIRPAFKSPERDLLCEFNGKVMTMGEWWDNHVPEETKRELLRKDVAGDIP